MIIKNNEFQFEIKNSSVEIQKYIGISNIKKLTIPNKINNLPVVSISDVAFDNCKQVESLSLPENLTYVDQNIMSCFKNLKSVIINNSDIEIDCDTFVANINLKYIILHRKLYNKMQNDNFPGISGKTGFEKYGINIFVTQLIPFGSEYVNVTTSNNCLRIYQDAINEYNSNLSVTQKMKLVCSNFFKSMFDKDGNTAATTYAYDYAKEHIRKALSNDDATIVNFLSELAKVLNYNDYNSFESFDDKIDESLYIMFINAIENNRMSVLREWISLEFRRHDAVHKKRGEHVLLCFNYLMIMLSNYFYKIEKPSFDDLKVITAFFFSAPSVDNQKMNDLISFVNKANTEFESNSEENNDEEDLRTIYNNCSSFNMEEIASMILLWALYNKYITSHEMIEFYLPLDELEDRKNNNINEIIKTIDFALNNRIEIELVMKILEDFSSTEDFCKEDILTLRKAINTFEKSDSMNEKETNNITKTTFNEYDNVDFNNASLVYHF